ncbi:MAG: hypothetical protein HYS09_02820 [Chloroflexi bacterium]|nr:hypothetical protein [Chloroflexota bacterium]
MTKNERVSAALRGDEVDRVPVSAWGHDFLREWSPEGLAAATLDAYRKYDWDFVKVNPRATYYAEAWGARFRPSGQPDQGPELVEAGVKSAADLARIGVTDVTKGPFGEQLAALRLIARELAAEARFIQTVFSPLAVVSRTTGSTKAVQAFMREEPERLEAALGAIAETLARYAAACAEAGASGIFFASVEWGSRDHISDEEYGRFGRPYDLRVLEAARDAPFNVLHVCRDRNHLEGLLDYPVAALHWAAGGDGNPSLAGIAGRTAKAVMGGVSQDSTLIKGTPAEVTGEARQAIAETGGRRFLLAPGCSADPSVPEANLHALREAAALSESRPKPGREAHR